MTDEVLKAQVDAYVDENWENIIEDIRYLVQVESVEDLSAAEAGKPWGPKSFEALRRGLELAERHHCSHRYCAAWPWVDG